MFRLCSYKSPKLACYDISSKGPCEEWLPHNISGGKSPNLQHLLVSVNTPHWAGLSYQYDIIKHVTGETVYCNTYIHCLLVTLRLVCCGYGTGLLLSHGVHAHLLYSLLHLTLAWGQTQVSGTDLEPCWVYLKTMVASKGTTWRWLGAPIGAFCPLWSIWLLTSFLRKQHPFPHTYLSVWPHKHYLHFHAQDIEGLAKGREVQHLIEDRGKLRHPNTLCRKAHPCSGIQILDLVLLILQWIG
jgi:hypothetical protein